MTATVQGTPDDDPNLGGPDDNLIIYGYSGNDTIFGNNDAAFSDTIFAGPGDDIIYDAHGADVVNGGAGNDTIRPGGNRMCSGATAASIRLLHMIPAATGSLT